MSPKFRSQIAFLLLLILVCACTSGTIAAPTLTVLPSSTTVAGETMVATALAWPPTSVQLATSTPTRDSLRQPTATPETLVPTEGISDIPTCQENGISNKPSGDYGITGTIAFDDITRGAYYAVGGTPLVYAPLPIPGMRQDWPQALVFGFSPNGEWLAYAPISYTTILGGSLEKWAIDLLSYQGNRSEHKLDMTLFGAVLPEKAALGGWLNSHWINDKLFYANLGYNEPGSLTITPVFSILDPFEGKWREDLLLQTPDFYRHLGVEFSPDMTRAVYAKGEAGTVLWNLTQETQVWGDKNYFLTHPFGDWAPDSSQVAFGQIGSGENLYISRRDGNRRISITEGFSTSKRFLVIPYLRWSPDGRYLAFIASLDMTSPQVLYIYDAQTTSYVYKCPLFKGTRDRDVKFYWSPDGKRIAYAYAAQPLIVIDLQDGSVTELAEKAEVYGWSDKFPTVWPGTEKNPF